MASAPQSGPTSTGDGSPTIAPSVFLLLGQGKGKSFHNQPEHWAHLAEILRRANVRSRVISDDLADLNARNLARFDVVLNFSTDLEANPEQIQALVQAVEQGTGYVGLHAATATFRDSEEHTRLIGGSFARHPPIKSFTVERLAADHPVTAGVAPFTIEDELYHLTAVAPDIRVLAWAEEQPMVYVRQHGAGRVCYIAPGHDHRTLGCAAFAQLVWQAIDWAARPS